MFGGEEHNAGQCCPLPKAGVVLHPEEQTADAGWFEKDQHSSICGTLTIGLEEVIPGWWFLVSQMSVSSVYFLLLIVGGLVFDLRYAKQQE